MFADLFRVSLKIIMNTNVGTGRRHTVKSSITHTLTAASLLLILLVTLTGWQTTAMANDNHGQGEAIPGSGMPDFQDGSG